MPPPRSRNHIENFESAISGVEFEFDFGHAVESEALQKPASISFNARLDDALDERARVAELDRILPRAPCDERGVGSSILANGAERKLILAGSWYALLDEDLVGREIARHRNKPLRKLRGIVDGK